MGTGINGGVHGRATEQKSCTTAVTRTKNRQTGSVLSPAQQGLRLRPLGLNRSRCSSLLFAGKQQAIAGAGGHMHANPTKELEASIKTCANHAVRFMRND